MPRALCQPNVTHLQEAILPDDDIETFRAEISLAVGGAGRGWLLSDCGLAKEILLVAKAISHWSRWYRWMGGPVG